MSVIRVQKNKNFTVMSNTHLFDKNLSLKAAGLLSKILALPDNWNYSIKGLCAICKESETAVKSALNELRERRYVIVERIEPSQETGGRIQYEYFVYEQPQGEENKKVDVKEAYKTKQETEKQPQEKQGVENLGVECLPIENRGDILNTNVSNTNKSNTDGVNTKELNTDNKHTLEDVKKPSSKGNIYTCVPEKHKDVPPKKQSRYIPPDYTEKQLIEHIRPTIEENLKVVMDDCGVEYNADMADALVDVIRNFYSQYYEKTGHRHRILPDASLVNVMYKFFDPPEELFDTPYDVDMYAALAEEYLSVKFDMEYTPSISHFMGKQMRAILYHKTK